MAAKAKSKAQTPKKATNVSIRRDVLTAARKLNINLSAELEKHLLSLIRGHRCELWREENAEAVRALNRYVAEHGIWGEEYRTF